MLLQVYEGLVYMDFNKELMDKQGYGTDSEILFLCIAYYFIYSNDHSLIPWRVSWLAIYYIGSSVLQKM